MVLDTCKLYNTAYQLQLKKINSYSGGGCSVAQLCLTLFDPTDYSMPGFPVLHHLREFAQTHVY